MKCSISGLACPCWASGLGSVMVVLGLLLVTMRGTGLESSGGWIACPPQVWVSGTSWRGLRRGGGEGDIAWGLGGYWWRQQGLVAAVRSEVLLGLVVLTGRWEWSWGCLLPWLGWLWQGLGLRWPGLGRQRW